ncbi:MAG: protein YgfX [Spongiibacteraceae bacterium]
MDLPSFDLQVTPSRWLRYYLSVVHVLVLLVLCYWLLLLDLADSLRVLIFPWLVIVVFLLWRYSCWCYVNSQHPQFVHGFSFREQVWCLYTSEKPVAVSLRAATVWRCLVVMNFKSQYSAESYVLVLLADSAEQTQLRRLRVMLRHMQVFEALRRI